MVNDTTSARSTSHLLASRDTEPGRRSGRGLWRSVFLFAWMGLAVGMSGCTGSKTLSKKGAQLEAAGMYDNAATYYYNALLRNSNNVDARIGLSRTGQRVVNDKLAAFTRASSTGSPREAVYLFREVETYREKLLRLGIKTDLPAYFPEDYREMESLYLDELYQKGSDLLADRKFEEAHRVFSEMETIKPGYRDVPSLRNITANEPIYTAAIADFDAGRYRAAYGGFDRVFKVDPNYKEVATLREECLDLGKFPLVIAPLENATGNRQIPDRLHAFITTQLSTLNDPFVRVVDRSDIDRVLAERHLSHSGLTETGLAQHAGSMLNAQAIVAGSIVKYHFEKGSWMKTTRKGYVRHTEKVVDKKTRTTTIRSRYEPTSYNVYSNQTSVTMEFRYRVISAQTGEILFSGIFDKVISDHAEYAVYSGEITELYPAGKEGPDTDAGSKRQLMTLLRADRTIKDADQLSKEACHSAASRLSGDLMNYLTAL